MSIFKHTVEDVSTRDVDKDNILDEKRIERKYLFGICYWKKESDDHSEYIRVKYKELGFSHGK